MYILTPGDDDDDAIDGDDNDDDNDDDNRWSGDDILSDAHTAVFVLSLYHKCSRSTTTTTQ